MTGARLRNKQDGEFRAYAAARIPTMQRMAYLMCGDWHRAEDAVQSAFVRLYSAWSRARRESIDAYMRRIVINALIDEHRRRWFRRERPNEHLPEHPGPDPSEASIRKITVMNALAKLPNRQRAVIVLRYWDDHTVEQTAQILQCTPGTVKSHTARGLQTLRGLLAETIHEYIQERTP